MSGGEKQQKNRRDSVENWRFHVLTPEHFADAAYHIGQPGPALAAVPRGLRAIEVETDGRGEATMILPGETETGCAGTQPCRGIAWWAHRNGEWQRRNLFLALLPNPHRIGRL